MFGSRRTDEVAAGAEVAPRLRKLETYWREIRGAALVPARSTIDPLQIDDLLPDCFIVERVAPTVLRMRVAGSRLNDALGLDLRGMPLSALFLPEGRDALARHAARVFEGPSIVELPILSPGRLGRDPLEGRMILLPLTDGQGRVTRAMGAMAWTGDIGHGGGRRFTVTDGPVRCDDPGVPLAPPGLVPPETPTAVPAGRPALRLVVDNT